MQFKYLAALLASTAVSGVIAGPEPVINARALEAREEQAEQAAQMQQMQQAQQAQQAKQAAQMQQAGQAAQVQQDTNAPAADPPKAADPKTDSASFSVPFFGGGGSGGGITVNYVDPSRHYPFVDPVYPIYPNRFGPGPIYNPVNFQQNFCPVALSCYDCFNPQPFYNQIYCGYSGLSCPCDYYLY